MTTAYIHYLSLIFLTGLLFQAPDGMDASQTTGIPSDGVLATLATACPPEVPRTRQMVERRLLGPENADIRDELELSSVSASDIRHMDGSGGSDEAVCSFLINASAASISATKEDGTPAFDNTIFQVQSIFVIVFRYRAVVEGDLFDLGPSSVDFYDDTLNLRFRVTA